MKTAYPKKKLSAERRACLEAVHLLTARNGAVPTPTDVANHLGISRTPAHKMMCALNALGLLKRPVVIYRGDWSVTPAGKKEIEKLDK